MEYTKKLLSFLKPGLVEPILTESKIITFKKGTEILRKHQSIKELPIVLSGIVKVFSRFEDKELLLYYIEPEQSCVMSFYASLKNTPGKVLSLYPTNFKIIIR